MKLQHFLLENALDFDKCSVWTLVCEKADVFCKLSAELYGQAKSGKGEWALWDKGKQLDIAKNVLMVVDYFNVSLSDKKAVALLQEQLKKLAFDEYHTVETHELLAAIAKYMNSIALDVDFPTSVTDVDFSQLLKAVSIAFLDEAENLFEKLMDYVTLLSRLTSVRILALANLRSYLPFAQRDALFKHCVQCQINLLCFESVCGEISAQECVLCCDEDLCEFFVKTNNTE